VLIFSGNSNIPLAEEVAESLGTSLARAQIQKFADGECKIQIQESMRGKDVYILQPTCKPVNENLVELLLMISTMKRTSAGKITAIIPYYGYARAVNK
jgi:ribose-phosphate pyrophosphokinase